jgi:hypothetical protein
MVCDLPLPVWPYAKTVLLKPFMACSTSGAILSLYSSGVRVGN